MALARCLISIACLACAYAVQLPSRFHHNRSLNPDDENWVRIVMEMEKEKDETTTNLAERSTDDVACEFVEHNSVGNSVDGGWQNDWDKSMNFQCPSGQALAGAYSVHSNSKEDRRWKFECEGFKAKTGYVTPYLHSCSWSGETTWDATWTAPNKGTQDVIVGVWSKHKDSKEDRKYQFKYCAVGDVHGTGQRSGVSGWQNSYDGVLDKKLSDTDFFGDWKSQHHNSYEDRRFAFDTVKFCMKALPTPSPTSMPTSVPTNSPTPPAHDCLSWCAKDTRDWSAKCGWNVCNDCADCGDHTCEQWCYNHVAHSWHQKCAWTGTCGGCHPCATLTPSPTNTPTDTPTDTPTNAPTSAPTLGPYVEHTSVGSGVDGGWVNDWDGSMNFECPSGQVLAGAYSEHDNGREDRRWKFECAGFIAKSGYRTPYLHSCSWSGETEWDGTWTAPNKGSQDVIVGVNSHHDNGREDRRFKFKSCAVGDVDGTGQRSGLSSWQNSYDGVLDKKLSDTDFFGDWKSQHHNSYEDRQFAFDTAKFRYTLA